MPRSIDVPALIEGVKSGDRAALARSITLVESRKPAHRARRKRGPSGPPGRDQSAQVTPREDEPLEGGGHRFHR